MVGNSQSRPDMDEAKLIQRAKAALYRYQDEVFRVEEESVIEFEGRYYVRLAGEGQVAVYRVQPTAASKTGDMIRRLKRPPAEIVGKP